MNKSRLCLDRIVPPRRDRPVHFTIPELNSANDASKAMAAITAAVAHGELTPTEAAELSSVIETYVRAIEASEIERRLRVGLQMLPDLRQAIVAIRVRRMWRDLQFRYR